MFQVYYTHAVGYRDIIGLIMENCEINVIVVRKKLIMIICGKKNLKN